MSSDQDVLNVTISGFHGRFDGKAIVRGEWVLNRRALDQTAFQSGAETG